MSEILQQISKKTNVIRNNMQKIKYMFNYDNFINCNINFKNDFFNIFNLNKEDYVITILVYDNDKSYIKITGKNNIKNKLLMSLNENTLTFHIYTTDNENIDGIENFDYINIS